MKKLESREQFVRQVLKTIVARDDSDGAFIFGISGKWGEGKTHFLKSMRESLSKSSHNIEVIELNPWKYARDDDSILRELLQEMLKLYPHGRAKKRLQKEVDALFHDRSVKVVNWTYVACVVLGFCVLLAGYINGPEKITDQIRQYKTPLTILLVPVLLAIANTVISSDHTTKAVSTRFHFESLFKKILEALKDHDKDIHIIVYVDDLDRLTAKKALSILDNLRTFFDKPELTFIVASDSVVLERHLGNELLPEGKPPEKLEEGRRFLKKIFNVYWRLPLPTKPEFNVYIEQFLKASTSKTSLYVMLTSDVNRAIFSEYLASYFANNFRNVERFVGRVKFTLSLIQVQSESSKTLEENKKYYVEMLENPLLVVRVLLIEELANPLFEVLQREPGLLMRIEENITRQDDISDIFEREKLDDVLSDEQAVFLKSFLATKPRFHDDAGAHARSLLPYIFLSSDSSFGDIRGLSPDRFTNLLSGESIDGLVEIIQSSGQEKLQEIAVSLPQSLDSKPDAAQKEILVNNLTLSISKLSVESLGREILTNATRGLNLDFVSELEPQKKLRLIEGVGNLGLEVQTAATLPALTQEDINTVDSIENITKLTQELFLTHFKNNFTSSPRDHITRLAININKFQGDIISTELGPMTETIVGHFVNENVDSQREEALEILRRLPQGIDLLVEAIKTHLNAKNQAMFSWSLAHARTSEPIIDSAQVIESLLMNPANSADLNERMSILITAAEEPAKIWRTLLGLSSDLLLDALFDISVVENFKQLSPSGADSNQLLELILRRYITKDSANEPRANDWLTRVDKNLWLFSNLILSGDTKRYINGKIKTKYLNEAQKEQLNRIMDNFGGKTK